MYICVLSRSWRRTDSVPRKNRGKEYLVSGCITRDLISDLKGMIVRPRGPTNFGT